MTSTGNETLTVEWNPEDYQSIGNCVVCGEPVYPANPDELKEKQPLRSDAVMHSECGW